MNKADSDKTQKKALWNEARLLGMSRREFLILIAAGGAAAVLASCRRSPLLSTTPGGGVSPLTTAMTQAPTTLAQPYGTLRVGASTFAEESFDPIWGSVSNAYQLIAPMFDSLLRVKGGELAPGIAERWELAADGLSWAYYIRKGVKFHNGDDLTAADVKFSLDRFMSKEAMYSDLQLAVDRVEVIDDYAVRVYTKGKQPFLPYTTALVFPLQGFIMPKDYINKNGLDYFKKNPVGSGPFKFGRHVKGDSVEFEAVNSHWRQVPSFNKLSIALVPEEATRLAMLKTRAMDLVETELESAPGLEASGFRIGNLQTIAIMINIHGAYQPEAAGLPVADIRVRQALSLAINRKEIMAGFFLGKALPPMPGFLTPESTDVDVNYWIDWAAKAYRYDVEQAKSLLKQAGYPDGFKIDLWSWPIFGSGYLPKVAEIVQSYWAKIGVQASLVVTDSATANPLRNTLKVPKLIGAASTWTWRSGAPITPLNLRSTHHSGGTMTQFGRAKPEFDRLVDNALGETDAAKRKALTTDALAMLAESYTAFQLAEVPFLFAIGPQVDINVQPPYPAISLYAEYAKHKQ